MKRVALFLSIIFSALSCEFEESDIQPYKLTSSEARIRDFLETALDTFENQINSLEVYQRQISGYTLKLQVAESENTYINLLLVDRGIRFYVVRFEEREERVEEYYYSFKNIRGGQLSWGHPDSPDLVKLTIELTEPYNWKN